MTRLATPFSKLLSHTHLSLLSPPLFPTHLRSMSHHNPTVTSPSPSPSPSSTAAVVYSPDVSKLQHIFTDDPSSGWKRSWEERLTPWDLQGPTPVVLKLLESESLPKGRALVPGCGSGYDVVTLASPERFVVGIDISEVAIKKARELASSSTNANCLSFLLADFFAWEPTDLFDLIFDYTFFCAIEPHLRPAWASRMRDLLKPNGELITLMFPIDDHDGGPPYKTSVSDYEKVLHPVGFKATLIEDNELAVAPRKGREKLGRWRRVTTMSSL